MHLVSLGAFYQFFNKICISLILEIGCQNCEKEFRVACVACCNEPFLPENLGKWEKAHVKQLFSAFKRDLYPRLLAACILTISILLVYSYGRYALLLASPSLSKRSLWYCRLNDSFLFLFSNQRGTRSCGDSREGWSCSTHNSGESELPHEVFASSVRS